MPRTRGRVLLALVYAALAVAGSPWLPGATVVASRADLVVAGDPGLPGLTTLRETFGAGETMVLLLEGEPAAVTEATARWTTRLTAWPEIGAILGPRPGIEAPELATADGRLAAILVEVAPTVVSGTALAALATRIRAEPAPPGVSIRLAGSALEELSLAEAASQDNRVLVPAAILVLALVSCLLLRSWRGGLVVTATIALTLVLSLEVYGALYGPLTVVTDLLVPMSLVMCASNAIHFTARFRDERGHAAPPLALDRTIRGTGLGCAVATLTSAVGFVSLATFPIAPIRFLAVSGALASLLTLVSVYVFLPGALLLLDPGSHRVRVLGRRLVLLARRDLRHRVGPVAVAVTTILAGLGVGAVWLRTDTTLTEELPSGAPTVEVARLLNTRLAGSVGIDLVWEGAPDARWDTPTGLARLAAAEAALRELDGVRAVLGAAAVAEVLARTATRLGLALSLEAAWREVGSGRHGKLPRWISADGRLARLTVWTSSESSKRIVALGERAPARLREHLRPQETLTATGTPLLQARMIEALVPGQAWSCLSAVLVVSLLAGVLLRSWRVLPVMWLPNLLPLLAVAGAAGWLRLPISGPSALVATLVFGLIVDDTIHFFARLRESGLHGLRGARRTVARLGTPFIATTLVITAGALVGVFGSVRPTRTFSWLLALGVGLALACDLYLTPRLAALAHPRRRKAP